MALPCTQIYLLWPCKVYYVDDFESISVAVTKIDNTIGKPVNMQVYYSLKNRHYFLSLGYLLLMIALFNKTKKAGKWYVISFLTYLFLGGLGMPLKNICGDTQLF